MSIIRHVRNRFQKVYAPCRGAPFLPPPAHQVERVASPYTDCNLLRAHAKGRAGRDANTNLTRTGFNPHIPMGSCAIGC